MRARRRITSTLCLLLISTTQLAAQAALSGIVRNDSTGAPIEGAEILINGTLDDQAPTTPVLPPIIVRPHVFLLPGDPGDLRLSAEVQYVRWAPLGELSRPEVLRPYSFEYRGTRMNRPGYHLGPDVVWGMTERILTPLLGMVARD